MIALIKPSEVVCVLIPMLWGLFEKNGPMLKIALIRESWKDIFGALLIALLVFTPQMTYWYMKTGTVLYDSYINPGVGLDFTTPHVIPLLFSFRKGWLVYTPIMLFALTGFLLMRKDRSAQLPVILIYFFSTLYIISSWSEWWYGSSFSIRPLITSYVLLAIPLGHTVRWISGCKAHLRGILVGVLVLLVCLNLFQTWQHNAGILRGYRMTAPFYFAVFGRTKVPKEAWKLLSIERSFDGNDRLVDTTGYDRVPLFNESFDDRTNDDVDAIWSKGARGGVLQLDSAAPFSPEHAVPYVELSKTEHVWIRARFRVFIPTDHPGGTPCLAIMLSRDEGNYAYRTRCSDDIERGVWQDVEMDYLTPHIRDVRDKLKVHVWHRGRHPVWIDDLHLEVWVPRNERR